MAGHLRDDQAFQQTTFVVIDFETTTPTGYRPEPIDVATLQIRLKDGRLRHQEPFQALMRPPAHAPVQPTDAEQTGITAQMVADQPPATQVLAELDATFTAPPYVLVAHHAPTEAGLLYDYRDSCPRLAATPLLDTLRLARVAYPDLETHRLDMLLLHLNIPRPSDRHRAMPDVRVTAEVFTRLLRDGPWTTLWELHKAGGITARAARPQQEELF